MRSYLNGQLDHIDRQIDALYATDSQKVRPQSAQQSRKTRQATRCRPSTAHSGRLRNSAGSDAWPKTSRSSASQLSGTLLSGSSGHAASSASSCGSSSIPAESLRSSNNTSRSSTVSTNTGSPMPDKKIRRQVINRRIAALEVS
jgi:hypothetical protein